MKYLVTVRVNPSNPDSEIVEHTVEADGFDRTDFDVVFWEYNIYKKENTALYPIQSVVFVTRIKKK